jgi:hypothetical protein
MTVANRPRTRRITDIRAEPKDKSRGEIDPRVDQTGLQLQDYDEMDMYAAHGLAMSEFPPGKNGAADYLLLYRP